jgi:hypothetical protein
MRQLTQNTKTFLAKSAVAAGSSNVTDASVIDTSGYEGVRFIFSFGTITANAVTSVGACSLDTSSPTVTTDDILGSGITVADTADDSIFILDIHKPVKRYVRPWVKRATANAVVNSIIAELYGPSKMPVTKDTTCTSQTLLAGPANGTA